MSNQPQASVTRAQHRLPAGLSAGGDPTCTHSQHTTAGGTPELLCCACWPPGVSFPLVTQPCIHAKEFPHKQQNLGRWTDVTAFASSSCLLSLCSDFVFYSCDSAHLSDVHDTISKVGSLKLRRQCRTTKRVRVITTEVFLGQAC